MAKYSPETVAYLQRHYNIDKTGSVIAAELGTTYKAIIGVITRLRKKGIEFAASTYNQPAQIGECRTRSEGDLGMITRMKTAGGKWKYVSRESGRKQLKPKPISMPRKKTNPNLPRQEPKPIKRTTMSDADKIALGWIWKRIDSRTIKLTPPAKTA